MAAVLPHNQSVIQVLALANTRDAQWIKKRRDLSHKRTIYSVKSDFLVFYTDNWFRNRCPDNDRVQEIMKSIEQEGEPDNRIYLALINGINKLMCFDGNHRREALIRLYYLKGFVCWIDLDILINVEDFEVVNAFKRINLGVSIPDIYIEDSSVPIEETIIHTCEVFVEVFKKKWTTVIVDKNKTHAPYCTKNSLIDLVSPYIKDYSIEKIMYKFIEIHNEHKKIKTNITSKNKSDCFIFSNGLKDVKKKLSLMVLQ